MSEEAKIKFIMKVMHLDRSEVELMTFGFNSVKLDQLLATSQKVVARELSELSYELA